MRLYIYITTQQNINIYIFYDHFRVMDEWEIETFDDCCLKYLRPLHMPHNHEFEKGECASIIKIKKK